MQRAALLLVMLVAGHSSATAAQRAEPTRFGADVGVTEEPNAPTPMLARIPRQAAPLASLIVPGLGQAVLGRERGIVYLAVETFAVLQYIKDVREFARERRQYRLLARDVARLPFGGARVDGDWDYYEAMAGRFPESGEFSESASAMVPEDDTLTYNGSRWILARRTFWRDPFATPPVGSAEYQQAIDFYLLKAIRPDFRWSWRNAALQHDLFRRSIDRSNDSAKRARSAATILLANHLLSAIDAFASIRLSEGVSPGQQRLRISFVPHW
jgi:hypothetical protein